MYTLQIHTLIRDSVPEELTSPDGFSPVPLKQPLYVVDVGLKRVLVRQHVNKVAHVVLSLVHVIFTRPHLHQRFNMKLLPRYSVGLLIMTKQKPPKYSMSKSYIYYLKTKRYYTFV